MAMVVKVATESLRQSYCNEQARSMRINYDHKGDGVQQKKKTWKNLQIKKCVICEDNEDVFFRIALVREEREREKIKIMRKFSHSLERERER
jgi:hypothetical protein